MQLAVVIYTLNCSSPFAHHVCVLLTVHNVTCTTETRKWDLKLSKLHAVHVVVFAKTVRAHVSEECGTILQLCVQ